MEKKQNIYKFFIKMCFMFLIFFLFQQIFSGLLFSSLTLERYGEEALFEIIWAGLVLILLLLYKNRYIFTEKRETFKNGFRYILPEVILSTIFLIISILLISTSKMPADIFSIINLLIYCIFIGIVEEFLCRGWLLNEFLERFSSNKKGIILSIIFSSLIFGVIHYGNISDSQNFIQTTVQVVNALVSGIFLALVYYKTKNIWLVVFSHAYWDFSLMLMNHDQLVDCYNEGALSNNAMIMNFLSGIIVIIAYLILCYWLYRQTDLYTRKDGKRNKNFLVIIGVGLYLIGLFGPDLLFSGDSQRVCPIYRNKEISSEFQMVLPYYSNYELSFDKGIELNDKMQLRTNEEYSFVLKTNHDNNKVIFENNNLDNNVVLYDDYFNSYLLIENSDSYIIVIQDSLNTLLYGRYLKSEISNDNDYLDKVKNNLVRYHVPNINSIGYINIKDDDYKQNKYVCFNNNLK